MKRFLFFILFIPFCSSAQNLEVLVSDVEANEPLPYANIYFLNSGIGASTDLQGLAIFKKDNLLKEDSIIVSYIGYDKQTLTYSKEKNKGTIYIKLVPSNQMLSELVVKYVKPPKPKKIIKTVIKNIPENYSSQDVIYKSLYRETVKENNTCIQLNEAIIKTYYTSYPKRKLDGNIWEDWEYDESYAFELEGTRFFTPLLKDFNTKKDHQVVLASRHSENLSQYGIETTLVGDPLLLFAFDKIKYQYDFFNPSVLNKYNLELENSEYVNGALCYVISFYPKSTDRRFRIDQSRKNKSPIYIGRMYITKESYALVKFQYKLAVDRDFGFFANRMPLDYQVEMSFKKQNHTYYVENIKFTETKKVGTNQNGEAILHTGSKELYVINTQTKNIAPFPDSSRFKSTRFSSIRHYKENYNPDYWIDLELPDTLKLGEKMISDLETNRPLSEQFESFKIEKKKDLPKPRAVKKYYAFNYHDHSVIDSLHWMASPIYAHELKKYLLEENRYAKNELLEDKKYQKKLFDQLNSFYSKLSDSVQVPRPGTYFIEEDSTGDEIYWYQQDSVERIEILNLTGFKAKCNNIFIRKILPGQFRKRVLVQYEKIGVIGDFVSILSTKENFEIDSVSNVYSVEWCTDSTFLYTKTNHIGSSRELRFRNIRTKEDSLVYTEMDSEFDVEVAKSGDHLFCTVQSKTENEIYLLNHEPQFPGLILVKRRISGIKTGVSASGDDLYLLINDEKTGSCIGHTTIQKPGSIKTIANSNKDDYITDILPLDNKIIALVYEKSIPKIKFYEIEEQKWHELELDLGLGDYYLMSSENEPNGFIFSFSSPSHPYAKYKYDFNLSQLEEISGPRPIKKQYYKYTSTKRIWAKSYDGLRIPITIIKSRAYSKSNSGLILRTYGAYGALISPFFNSQDAVLLEQGYTIAYAHVRGESILGKSWYKSGRELQKANSILDYLSSAEYLIKKGKTSPEQLIGYGNSAGGLIVAQAANLKPELFNTIILDHPYLDVINTMMNDTLPLTKDEYKEWGNPQNKEVYDYILSYSPYQNIKPQNYPNTLLIGSYQDYQTPVWQIAKYKAKLQQNNLSDDTKILMLTDMNSGHIGNTIGKEWIKLFSETYSFVKTNNKTR